MTLSLVAPPSADPVSVAEAKAHLRVTFAEEDALIARLIIAARERVEAELGLCLVETGLRELRTTWSLDADGGLTLARGPLIGVDAVQRVEADGALTALAFSAEPGTRPSRVRLAAAPWWAVTPIAAPTLRIDYRAGFGPAAANVPETLRQAVLALIADAFEHRGEGPASPAVAEPWLAGWRRMRL